MISVIWAVTKYSFVNKDLNLKFTGQIEATHEIKLRSQTKDFPK